MAIEAGAKNGIFPVDDVTLEYLNGRFKREVRVFEADADAEYERVIEVDMSKLQPTVAFPHLPENTRTPRPVGRREDRPGGHRFLHQRAHLRSAHRGKYPARQKSGKGECAASSSPPPTPSGNRPCTRDCLTCLSMRAPSFSTPTCGPCLGGHMGILAAGERAVATHQPQLCGTHGPRGQRSVPRFPLRRLRQARSQARSQPPTKFKKHAYVIEKSIQNRSRS